MLSGILETLERWRYSMILVILQNAWYHKNKKKPYDKWLIALWKSQTGKNLIKMLPEGIPYFIINSTDEIIDNPDDALEANHRWIRRHYFMVKPKLVLACGRIAQEACEQIGIPHMKVPHPTWRQFSNRLAEDIKEKVRKHYDQ